MLDTSIIGEALAMTVLAVIVLGAMIVIWIIIASYGWDQRRSHLVTVVTKPKALAPPVTVFKSTFNPPRRTIMLTPVPDAQEGIEPSYVGPTAKAVPEEALVEPIVPPIVQLDPASLVKE